VVTIVNGVNNDQVGPIVEFAVDNADKITVVSFQPVSFTGRDEDVDDETREKQRYTLSHLARDVAAQSGVTEPLRDWFPLSALSPFGDVCDLLDGPDRDFGQLNCGCHPNCGIGTVLFVNKKHEADGAAPRLPRPRVGLLADCATIFDAGRGKRWTAAQLVPRSCATTSPRGAARLHVDTLIKQFLSQMGARHGENDANEFEWRVLFVAGMWFQDLFNYDFRRTEMCIIPYGTQIGEISFCAYNTGAGWRNVIEKMKANATVAEWYKSATVGTRCYAKNKDLQLPSFENELSVREHDLALAERAQGTPPPKRKKLKHLPVIER
jgi:uncharacterized radical SAM superfamily Fe-S cluster-containing enzyme